jgi:hypothetical protein
MTLCVPSNTARTCLVANGNPVFCLVPGSNHRLFHEIKHQNVYFRKLKEMVWILYTHFKYKSMQANIVAEIPSVLVNFPAPCIFLYSQLSLLVSFGFPHFFLWNARIIIKVHHYRILPHLYWIITPDHLATGYGLDDREIGVRVPVRSRVFTSPIVQIASGVHPTSYTMGTMGSFPLVKRPGWEATNHLQLVPRWRKYGSIHPIPHMSSWRSA